MSDAQWIRGRVVTLPEGRVAVVLSNDHENVITRDQAISLGARLLEVGIGRMSEGRSQKQWHPRVELRWRSPPETTTEPLRLEQLWQCEQTGELWWRAVPVVAAWESSEP